ncbi:transcription factor HES-2-like [Anarrhichthys ocellatus]|uniref:transcription factor HES-2-like n=1 Tax=Anarrhichthys ocellatus TaxID=433405 RepID=UPI0012ECC50C|nr:transcription factor HES-2-like [Anarrhichthys ocellatus]
MKLLQQPEDATNERKVMKSQVEKRRRERMNHSLECLRTMLLQEPQQMGGTQHRVEKAEILEHTVLFLQKTAKRDETRASSAASSSSSSSDGGGDEGGGQKHSFQDGLSTCLQTAAQFLGPEGKGLWLGAALDASLAAHFSHSDPAGVQRRTEGARSSSSSLPHTKSILRVLRHKSKHRPRTTDFSVTHPYRLPVQQGFPTIPQQAQIQNMLEMRRASKQSPAQSSPVSQTLWRPWP